MQEIPERLMPNEALITRALLEGLRQRKFRGGGAKWLRSLFLPSVRVHTSSYAAAFSEPYRQCHQILSNEPPQVRVHRRRATFGSWMFAVADNGIGIAPEYQEDVFGLFKRLRTPVGQYSRNRHRIGHLLKRMVGPVSRRIDEIDSGPGQASTFRFSLPG